MQRSRVELVLQALPRRSAPISAFFSTLEAVPGRLGRFEPVEVEPSRVTWQWELPPHQANGRLTGFTIQWGPRPEPGKPFIPEESRHFPPTETRGTLEGLLPGQKYTFRIQVSPNLQVTCASVLSLDPPLHYLYAICIPVKSTT